MGCRPIRIAVAADGFRWSAIIDPELSGRALTYPLARASCRRVIDVPEYSVRLLVLIVERGRSRHCYSSRKSAPCETRDCVYVISALWNADVLVIHLHIVTNFFGSPPGTFSLV